MHTFISIGSVVIGIIGLAFLMLQPLVGIALIVIGLLLYMGTHNAQKRDAERQWRDQMLYK